MLIRYLESSGISDKHISTDYQRLVDTCERVKSGDIGKLKDHEIVLE